MNDETLSNTSSCSDAVRLIDFTETNRDSEYITSRKVFILSRQDDQNSNIDENMVFSDDNSSFAVISPKKNSNSVYIYFTYQDILQEFSVDSKCKKIFQIASSISPDESLIAISYMTGQVDYFMLNRKDNQMHLLASYKSPKEKASPLRVAFASIFPNEKTYTAVIDENEVLCFGLDCMSKRFRVLTHSDNCFCLKTSALRFVAFVFFPESMDFMVSDSLGKVHVTERQEEHIWIPHEGSPVDNYTFVNYWGLVTVCEANSEIKLWDIKSWHCLNSIRFQYLPKNGVEFDDFCVNLRIIVCSGKLLLVKDSFNHLFVLSIQPDEDQRGVSHVIFIQSGPQNLLVEACKSWEIITLGNGGKRESYNLVKYSSFPSKLINDNDFPLRLQVTLPVVYTSPPIRNKPCRKELDTSLIGQIMEEAFELETRVVETDLKQIVERQVTLIAEETNEIEETRLEDCTPVELDQNVECLQLNAASSLNHEPSQISQEVSEAPSVKEELALLRKQVELFKEELISLKDSAKSQTEKLDNLPKYFQTFETETSEKILNQIRSTFSNQTTDMNSEDIATQVIADELDKGFRTLREDLHTVIKSDMQTIKNELPNTIDYQTISANIFDQVKNWLQVHLMSVVQVALNDSVDAFSDSVSSKTLSNVNDQFVSIRRDQAQHYSKLESILKQSGNSDLTRKINDLFEKKEFKRAFELALNSGDVECVRSLCRRIDDFAVLFDGGDFSQEEYLSIISCLSTGAPDWEEMEINCLFESLSRLNLEDSKVGIHAQSVLMPLQGRLASHKPLKSNNVRQFSQYLDNAIRVVRLKK